MNVRRFDIFLTAVMSLRRADASIVFEATVTKLLRQNRKHRRPVELADSGNVNLTKKGWVGVWLLCKSVSCFPFCLSFFPNSPVLQLARESLPLSAMPCWCSSVLWTLILLQISILVFLAESCLPWHLAAAGFAALLQLYRNLKHSVEKCNATVKASKSSTLHRDYNTCQATHRYNVQCP